jgi:hypothetical protein
MKERKRDEGGGKMWKERQRRDGFRNKSKQIEENRKSDGKIKVKKS